MNQVTWYHAAAYCNWLSEQEGLPKDQWCYLPNEQKKYDKGMKVPADFLQRKGYRLPTEVEWEYASRAAAMTSRHYGLSVDLLKQYARYEANSHNHAWPCGSLMPNDLGLFDTLGNVTEWCQERATSHQPGKAASPMSDIIDDAPRLDSGRGVPLSSGVHPLGVPGLVRAVAPGLRHTVFASPGLTTEPLTFNTDRS